MIRAVASSWNTSPVPPAGPTLQTLPPRAADEAGSDSAGTSGSVLAVSPATVVVVAPDGAVVVDAPAATVVVGARCGARSSPAPWCWCSPCSVRRDGPPAAVVVGGRRGRGRRRRPTVVVVSWSSSPRLLVGVRRDARDVELIVDQHRPQVHLAGDLDELARPAAWFFTPGRLTTMASPWRRISGSATPRLSTRSRIRSTARSRLAVLKSPTGCWVIEMPPCRSRPSDGLLPATSVANSPPNARTRMPTSE